MPTNVRQTALFSFLSTGEYADKLIELRTAVTSWLEQIPATFPHYTRHTVDHSDAIVFQASRLLFDDSKRPVVNLSPVEAYVIGASAYLHDAGMVVLESEKIRILASEDWRAWVSEGQAGHERWSAVKALRSATELEETTRHFLADLELRYLIAEFVRRQHHLRSAQLLKQHESVLGRFAFGDQILIRTIAEVCAAHGLSRAALSDRDRYPDRTDVRGETVSVRFCAIMLRLADLLDLSTDRACPLLLAQGCPLPADSLAHWNQYRCIQHRLTTTDVIELTAECENQAEHRVLQDWCRWLVDELNGAATLMARSSRHNDWRPPRASMDGNDATILIRPASGATYRPARWIFEIDHETILNRLVHDLYGGRLAFLRELVSRNHGS
ncbi:MAG: hypothetical protein HOP16_08310 [Acidobacteria bacterium]|nr:hypothetical protein [Acidobacteriota bacterium]